MVFRNCGVSVEIARALRAAEKGVNHQAVHDRDIHADRRGNDHDIEWNPQRAAASGVDMEIESTEWNQKEKSGCGELRRWALPHGKVIA
jgi:hypothetical protein